MSQFEKLSHRLTSLLRHKRADGRPVDDDEFDEEGTLVH